MRAIFRLTAIPAAPRRGILALLVTIPATAVTGTCTATIWRSSPGAGNAVRHGPLAAQTAAVTIGLGGTSMAARNPALTVTAPALVTAGTYAATVVHSVA